MLVMSRKEDEAIDIGSDIEIVVVSIRGDRVRIGVRAPDDVLVNRREVTEEIARQDAKNDDRDR